MSKKVYKFGLYDEDDNLLDIAEFEFDSTNYQSPWQQVGAYLIPRKEMDAYNESDQLDSYELLNGEYRFIKQLKGHDTRVPSKKPVVKLNVRAMF